MKVMAHKVLACLLLGSATAAGHAQAYAPPSSSSAADQVPAQLEQRMETISAALAATQQQLEQSQRQMEQLQHEIIQLRQQMASNGAAPVSPSTPGSSSNDLSRSVEAAATQDATTATTEERLQSLEAQVKLHDQTKVESSSKYRVRINGLVLFNTFLNEGLPDNVDLPAVALRPTSTSGNSSFGASLRQTILGIEGNGPRIVGARTSANVSFDFFSGLTYTSYGSAAGEVRLRTGSINFDWAKDSVQLGMVTPLISPLSPSSYATVAEPSLAGAGNLWTWAPQLEYTHRFALQKEKELKLEFGLWDSPSAGYNPNQLFRIASPAELAQQPAYETLLSYGSTGANSDRGLLLGVGGYYSRQAYPGYQGYPGTKNLDSWAATAIWRVPFARHYEISGEGYRGRSIGGLGGGLYKDAIPGTDPVSGESVLRGLNAIGGWIQFKTRFNQSLETNASIGQDNGFAGDFHAVVLPPIASTAQLRARNKMVVANLIYRPKTYIILSPEYRRIWTWPISGPANTLNIYTLSVGYQF